MSTDIKQIQETNSQQGEIVLYQPDETVRLEVRLENETVWLTQAQIAELFQKVKSTISFHISNIFKEGELNENVVVRKNRTTTQHGAISGKIQTHEVAYYNLDVIISVGYRVKSLRGTQFRQWATGVIRDHLLRGYTYNRRIEMIETKLDREISAQRDAIKQMQVKVEAHQEKIDFFVRTSLPPVEGIFYDGQIFDAYRFVADLIRKATRRIILIDNYVDDTVLTMLDKRARGVTATIYTQHIGQQLQLDLKRHNTQYEPIEINPFNRAHDRFLLIDDEVYHIGASLKDLGRRWFAFTLMHDIKADDLIARI